MDKEKIYIATVYLDPVKFDIYNCKTLEEAYKNANELAEDFAKCCNQYGEGISVNSIEVEEG